MEVKEVAKDLVRKLATQGYIAYFAGGFVRDYLMQNPSQDIDIATDAPPEKIVEIFKRTVKVGISFGVVVVILDHHQFEVSTFRTDLEYLDGRRPVSVIKSSPEEDAKRRDFTINGLFYDPLTDQVIDYVDGIKDIEKGVIRTIGEPHERFSEDRLRMIRAVRFAARFQFTIEEGTKRAIKDFANTLFPSVARERVWQELGKMASHAHFDQALLNLHELGLLKEIFPELKSLTVLELTKCVEHFHAYPRPCPLIVYLMDLFHGVSIKELTEIFKNLKVKNQDIRAIEFMYESRELFSHEEHHDKIDIVKWVHFYAHPLSSLCLHIEACKKPLLSRQNFTLKHERRKNEYKEHIDRIIERRPLISSHRLRELGVVPGKNMGVLLDEAVNIAIENNSLDENQILTLLKTHPAFKEKEGR